MIRGGCYCGAVRYEGTGEIWHRTVCHCGICRRTTGAPCVAWLTIRRSAFRLAAGAPAWFRSSAAAQRAFCRDCGTAIAYAADDLPDEIDLTVASLDDADAQAPDDHVWVSRRLAWVDLPEQLPAHPEARPDPASP